MSEERQLKEIKVFVSSPKDVASERDEFERIVREVDTRIARAHGLTLLPVRWEHDAISAAGDPQTVIDDQLGRYGVYVGIMWKRFGTPQLQGDSGTEVEFRRAYELWQTRGKPWIMFFFCTRGPLDTSAAEHAERAKVVKFMEEVGTKALCCTFQDDFGSLLREQLTTLVVEHLGPKHRNGNAVPVPMPPSAIEVEKPHLHLIARHSSRDTLRARIRKDLLRVSAGDAQLGLRWEEAAFIARFMATHDFPMGPGLFRERSMAKQMQSLYPGRKQRVQAFHLSSIPVTNELFDIYARENEPTAAEREGASATWRTYYGPDRKDHPVRCVSFDDAQRFCDWAGVRLPTVDEREWAARSSDKQYLFSWGPEWRLGMCNDIYFRGAKQTTSVRHFKHAQSPEGFFDLCGNVYEWVVAPPDREEVTRGDQAVAGGSYRVSVVVSGHSAVHKFVPTPTSAEDIGFRVAMDLE